ncbi:MAG: hypothetical protein E6J64_13135 [Deltaproteobacteria bacterium]|nr:MAG: hypothetical protein E6J64_13135 [Deltaproteobacteria bacterium]
MDEVLHLRPLRHPAVEWREIGGEATLVRVVEEFEVDLATAEHDAAEFVREMLQGGLLLPGDGASA